MSTAKDVLRAWIQFPLSSLIIQQNLGFSFQLLINTLFVHSILHSNVHESCWYVEISNYYLTLYISPIPFLLCVLWPEPFNNTYNLWWSFVVLFPSVLSRAGINLCRNVLKPISNKSCLANVHWILKCLFVLIF